LEKIKQLIIYDCKRAALKSQFEEFSVVISEDISVQIIIGSRVHSFGINKGIGP